VKILKEESGTALVIGVLSLGVLMGGMALAIDVGNMQYRQRQLQTAADAAAVAAGLEISNCGNVVCAHMKTAAAQALIEDGITTATITPTTGSPCTVTSSWGLAMMINVGPCVLGTSDKNNGNTNVAEVVLTEPQSTFFGGFLGMSRMNLVARAEAGDAYIQSASAGGNCLWAGSIEFNSSNGKFNLTNCGIYDDGNLQTNDHDSVTATDFLYHGVWNTNNCNGTCTWNLGQSQTQPGNTTTQQPDPLASVTPPTQPATQDANNCSISNQDCWGHNTTAGQPVALAPGYYGGGININSGYTVNFSPGLYYFNGSLNVDSGATLECTTCTQGGAGVTLYFTNGSFQPNSNSTVTLNAPATGDTSSGSAVANMLVWESSTNSTGMEMDSSTSVTLNGIIYLPDARLTLNSGSGTTIDGSATAVAVDVKDIIVNAGVTFNLNGSQLLGGGSSTPTLGTFAIVE
jgi:Flp pilus assembly protein TadG